jgi:hypothetical protein
MCWRRTLKILIQKKNVTYYHFYHKPIDMSPFISACVASEVVEDVMTLFNKSQLWLYYEAYTTFLGITVYTLYAAVMSRQSLKHCTNETDSSACSFMPTQVQLHSRADSLRHGGTKWPVWHCRKTVAYYVSGDNRWKTTLLLRWNVKINARQSSTNAHTHCSHSSWWPVLGWVTTKEDYPLLWVDA